MSVSDRWLLPDGVEELLPPQAAVIEDMRRRLIDLFQRWGYELIIPPLIEYLDSLLTGAGHDLDLQTFKITDQLTGRLMGVRADMTPQSARIDARRAAGRPGSINRLCYIGSVLHTTPANMLTSRTPIQAGCELFGQGDISADIEILSLMVESLNAMGIAAIHVDLAHVSLYRVLIARAGLSGSLETQLFDALKRRAIPEIDEFVNLHVADARVADMLRQLPRLAGGRDTLARARTSFAGEPDILAALDAMEQVADAVAARYPDVRFHFDFCELRGYNYHTGLVFAAYTSGYGQALAQGGRYDGAGAVFGESRPATGFSLDVKALHQFSTVSLDAPAKAILAPAGQDPELWRRIQQLRRSEIVIQLLPGQERSTVLDRCDRELVWLEGEWRLQPLAAGTAG